MKQVMTFETDVLAIQRQQELDRHGIKSRILVDPLASSHPALSQNHAIALMVTDDATFEKAMNILSAIRKAS